MARISVTPLLVGEVAGGRVQRAPAEEEVAVRLGGPDVVDGLDDQAVQLLGVEGTGEGCRLLGDPGGDVLGPSLDRWRDVPGVRAPDPGGGPAPGRVRAQPLSGRPAWDETGAQILGDLADELGIHFGELFTCRQFAATGSDVPVRFWEDVVAGL